MKARGMRGTTVVNLDNPASSSKEALAYVLTHLKCCMSDSDRERLEETYISKLQEDNE